MKPWILCLPLSLAIAASCNDRDSYASPKTDKNPPMNPPLGGAQTPDDQTLTQRAEQALRDDSALSASASRVTITAQNGVVTLNGQVDTQEQRTRIEDKVRAVSGVTSVTNRLEVKG